jgi:predicted Zn-dependent protease
MGARLIVPDFSHYQTILTLIPSKNIKLSSVHHPWRNVLILMVSGIALLALLLWGIPRSAPFIAHHIPAQWDDKLGQYLIHDVAKNDEECVAPNGRQALNKIVAKLNAQLSHQEDFDVRVLKLSKEDINAFAVPGNHIIIYSGLLDFADNADEIAGVLAHEMGHALEHHPTQGIIRKLGIQLVLTSAFGSSIDYPTLLLHLKYSRNDEQQADDIAVLLLEKAKIDTGGLVKFFEKLARQYNVSAEHETILEYFSDHPGLMERIERIHAQSKQAQTIPTISTQDWQALQNICNQTGPLDFEKK